MFFLRKRIAVKFPSVLATQMPFREIRGLIENGCLRRAKKRDSFVGLIKITDSLATFGVPISVAYAVERLASNVIHNGCADENVGHVRNGCKFVEITY